MKIIQYEGNQNKNPSRNPYEEKTRETTERVRNIDRGSQMNLIAEPSSKFLDFLKKWWILILIISIIIIAGIIISLVLCLKKDKEQVEAYEEGLRANPKDLNIREAEKGWRVLTSNPKAFLKAHAVSRVIATYQYEM